MLVLKGNEVCEAEYFKEWIVFKCGKSLRSLDFERINDKVSLTFSFHFSSLLTSFFSQFLG